MTCSVTCGGRCLDQRRQLLAHDLRAADDRDASAPSSMTAHSSGGRSEPSRLLPGHPGLDELLDLVSESHGPAAGV
jgi:hypothetical protein